MLPTDEMDTAAVCAQCGAEFWPELERGYAFGEEDDQVLCYACAIQRGGVYDELNDRWSEAPTLSGLRIDLGERASL
jgi:hypothetical protein